MRQEYSDEIVNPKNGYTSEIEYETFTVFQYDKKYGKLSYKALLSSLREQAIFSNLCDMVENPSWCSFQYANLAEICDFVGESTATRMGKLLNKFENLGLIKKEDFKHTKRIYINPTYCCCSTRIKDYTLNLFNCSNIRKAVAENEQG